MRLPGLYAIADAGVLAGPGVRLREYAEELRAAGVTLVQYRDKDGTPQEVLRGAALIVEAFAGAGATLIMNDRADLAVLAGFDGVHVGQGDLPPEDAKAVVRSRERYPTLRMEPEGWGTQGVGARIVGVSTHTKEQVRAADVSPADYVAIGPVFSTGTKLEAAAVVGLEGVRRARALTMKPLVAIGGIRRENARSVIEAGADSVAVISGLLVAGQTVEKVARDFMDILR